MPRIRTIKPEISFHEKLFDAEQETGYPLRFVWSVMPCHCDREGRFEWRSRALGAQILPYDGIDFSRVLDALWTRDFLIKYEENGRIYGWIPSFARHQVINNRESASLLPEPRQNNTLARESGDNDGLFTRESRVDDACSKEGKGKEGNISSSSSDTREKFSMFPEWEPTDINEQLELLKVRGLTGQIYQDQLNAYRISKLGGDGDQRTQNAWSQAFVATLNKFCVGLQGKTKPLSQQQSVTRSAGEAYLAES